MKSILILSFSDLRKDPRVRRQISCLSQSFRVTAAGLADPQLPGVDFVPLPQVRAGKFPAAVKLVSLVLRLYDLYHQAKHDLSTVCDALRQERFDIIIANDADALPLAFSVAGKAKVFADLHEYAPRELEESLLWRLLYMPYREYLCRSYLQSCAAVTTVCDGIAVEYHRNFGVKCEVITNAAPYVDLQPSQISPDGIRLVHHGVALQSRGIEVMIEMMAHLDERFSLTLMLVPSDRAYYDRLVSLAARTRGITFAEPVPISEIVPVLNSYDIGVYILEPNNFNNRHALPNKFFEFVQARLAIAIGPSPEMAGLVQGHDLGVVAADFNPQTLASQLNGLTREKIQYYKQRSCEVAKLLSSEANMRKLLKITGELLD